MIGNYLICATARSGSNFLCEILTSLGFAGRPFEHLWEPPGSDSEPLTDRWPRILRAGRSENGVFATKLLWYQAERLERELPEALGRPDMPLGDVLAATLADPQYIYLTRLDRIRQAVSFARAIQTEQWRSMDTAASELHYDAEAITQAMQALAQEEASWERFFARHGITPYRLMYEDLDAAPRVTVDRLLRFLGHDEPLPASLPESLHRKQADAITDAWVRRYQSERSCTRGVP